MLSIINKREELGNVFKSLEHVVEVYADTTFNMEHELVDFVLLCKLPINSSKALYDVNKCFDMLVRIYVVYDAYSALLKDKRIIWREGVWYV